MGRVGVRPQRTCTSTMPTVPLSEAAPSSHSKKGFRCYFNPYIPPHQVQPHRACLWGEAYLGLLGFGGRGRGVAGERKSCCPLDHPSEDSHLLTARHSLLSDVSLHAYMACAEVAKTDAICLAYGRQTCFKPGELTIRHICAHTFLMAGSSSYHMANNITFLPY